MASGWTASIPTAIYSPHRTVFDDGFSVDLRQPSTVADALLTVMEMTRADRSP